ncbi:MAG: glycosyltransferase [Breznakibacter sp.]|nr:glycosyltransferase [Breznakibacter sp.]
MSKVLIIGPNFYNFCTAVARAFNTHGWEVFVEKYDNPIHPYTTSMKWRYKFACDKPKMRDKSLARYQTYIIERFNEVKPDLVFLLNGDWLTIQTIDLFRQTARVACWLFDRLYNLPNSVDHINHINHMFCYDQEDVFLLAQTGKKVSFLPQACDTTIYVPQYKIKDIDILFVGNLYKSRRRRAYVKVVVKAFPNKIIRVIGEYKPWYKNPLKCLFRESRSIYLNKNVPEILVNDYYNRAKVVLNIHNEQQQNGANPKVFEISGSGAYQICDSNPYIKSLYPNGEIGLYNNEQELIDLIEDGLTTDKTNQTEKAYQFIVSNHTFEKRVEQMLDILYNHA